MVLMFNLWTIPARKEQRDRIDRTHRRQLRSVMGHYFKEDEPMVTCQEICTQTDSVSISVELTERRWTLLGHILRLAPDTPANIAIVQYFRKTLGGIKRTSYAGTQRTSIMTMMRDEYRSYTNTKMKQIVGTPHFTHEADLDKLRGIAQDNTKWAYLVNHITNMMSLMGQNKLHPETTRGAVEQQPDYSSATRRLQNPQTSSATARCTTTAGLRRDIIIRGHIIYVNIPISIRDTRYRR